MRTMTNNKSDKRWTGYAFYAAAVASFVMGALTGRASIFDGFFKREEGRDLRPQLLYPDLKDFGKTLDTQNVISVMYDFGSQSLIKLSDLTRDGLVDHLEVENCEPYRHGIYHIYISNELAPAFAEDRHFHVVGQTFFDTFNKVLKK